MSFLLLFVSWKLSWMSSKAVSPLFSPNHKVVQSMYVYSKILLSFSFSPSIVVGGVGGVECGLEVKVILFWGEVSYSGQEIK